MRTAAGFICLYLDITDIQVYYTIKCCNAAILWKEAIMPNKPNPEPAGRARETSPASLLTEWVRQGTESFFATQRILLDLVMRQNANSFNTVRERLAGMGAASADALTEIAGEGISNFIAAQR